jgi:DNA invertase Pin-like site-specific DNA recombinase
MARKKRRRTLGQADTDELLKKMTKQLDMISLILLAQSGVTTRGIARALGLSKRSIQRIFPPQRIGSKWGVGDNGESSAQS